MKLFYIITILMLGLCLNACETVKPDGALKDLSEGDIFTQDVRDPGPANNHLPETEPKPPMRWKIEM